MSRFILIVTAFLFILGSFTYSALAQLGDEGGLNYVFIVLPESPGVNCANGGSVIASGPDLNGSGNLNYFEVQHIGYACNGADGLEGPEGPMGATGPPGPIGPAGPTGATGPAGPIGPAGPTGATGPAGPAGADGTNGTDGVDGADGADGLACWDTNGNGVGDPAEDINTDGMYNTLDCIGPQGPQGVQGVVGAQGPAGPTGATGAQGPQGETGAIGPQGPQGPAGPTGATGPQGPAGADGADGFTGFEILSAEVDFQFLPEKSTVLAQVFCSDPNNKMVLSTNCYITQFEPNITRMALVHQGATLTTLPSLATCRGMNVDTNKQGFGVMRIYAVCINKP